MHKHERKKIILDVVNEKRFIETRNLLLLLESKGINESTARRDLKELESENKVLLSFGSVTSKIYDQFEKTRVEKTRENKAEKEIIGHKAAELLEKDEVIFCSGGTSIENFVKLIDKRVRLLITNSFPVFLQAWKNENIADVYLLGGFFREKTQVFFSNNIKKWIEGKKFSKAFFSCVSVDEAGNLYDDFEPESTLMQEVMTKTKQLVLLADSSKFLSYGVNLMCNMSQVDYLVTDDKTKDIIKDLNWDVKVIFGGTNEQ
ncbi:DeoR family transcriptional regulator, lactose phosphotransferase system repressor [Spiroplasma helicoides]|uniref:Lactose phosphotransferase system repressor n=1 Tax=Spiroplasma helicoides TaxID=216938 RepID=A0A1B3SK69_9MOLU|nr:DeoR/GlpR family DNA-binding transcription regulator [Spiroplasma helicoides]AOG60318.1 DeoR family transcriptional regulator, lactose phosphotransferase system repressor [Spiroplasma helicoides]